MYLDTEKKISWVGQNRFWLIFLLFHLCTIYKWKAMWVCRGNMFTCNARKRGFWRKHMIELRSWTVCHQDCIKISFSCFTSPTFILFYAGKLIHLFFSFIEKRILIQNIRLSLSLMYSSPSSSKTTIPCRSIPILSLIIKGISKI